MEGAIEKLSIDQFSKDHWSLLAYLETLCVDSLEGIGKINLAKMRCNLYTHPCWSLGWGTRYLIENKLITSSIHDDWNCLDDLVREELVKELGDNLRGNIKLTSKGIRIAFQLRKFKIDGGRFIDFKYTRSDQNEM